MNSQSEFGPEPTCYFLTFHTYGTWFHGDGRGSVDRRNNIPGQPVIETAPAWETWQRRQMTDPPMVLSEQQRTTCDEAIQGIIINRGWNLFALNVRTNHVHIVVSARHSGERVMNDCKAFATKALRLAKLVDIERRVWARHGSVRVLSRPADISAACLYVIERQGARQGTVGDAW